MQTNQLNNQLPLQNYEPISEEAYADLKFKTEETRPFSYDLNQKDRGVNKFDIAMDNLLSGVNALVKLNNYAVNPFSKFSTPELDWMPEYNSSMEEIVDLAKKNPVKFTQAVAQGALESAYNLATEPEVVIPEYISNLSGAVKDQFTKSIDDFLKQMYGSEVTVFNATDEQLTEARSAMLFRTLEATEAFGITAAAPKITKAITMGGLDSYQKGVNFVNYSAPAVKQNILKIADGLTSAAEEAMGRVPIRINAGSRNNTSSFDNGKIPSYISAMLLPATSGDIKTGTGGMYRPSGWGSRQTYPVAKQKLENYFADLEDKFDYDFEENFVQDFKKLSVFHQEETLEFLNTIWKNHGWTLGPNNQLFTEIADNLATFKSDKFVKSSFADIKNPSIWEFISRKAQQPFESGPQAVATPSQTGEYSFNYLDADGNIKSFSPKALSTNILPPEFKLGELLNHKELFKAYPEFKDLKIRFFSNKEMKERGIGNLGFFSYGNPQDDFIGINYSAFSGKPPEKYMTTLLHEIQHAIEHRSGVDIASKSFVKDHLEKKIELVDKGLKDIKPYNDDPSLINKHATVMGVKSDQVKAFLQGTEQGNYNIIFLHPGDIQDKNESAKFNLQLVLARDHFITKDYDPTEWKEIDLKTAENLLKIQLYETKTLLGSKKMMDVTPMTASGPGTKSEVPIFSTQFFQKSPQELAGGKTQIINPETFFNRINRLVFKHDKNPYSITGGDIFEYGTAKKFLGSDPVPQLGLNIQPDFFNAYLANINEAMARITDSSIEMSLSERKKSLPYERIGLGVGDIVREKGIFYGHKPGKVQTARDISLAELIYYVEDKQSATKSIENTHASLVESIKSSDIMKNRFLPMMTQAAYDANMSTDQATKYYSDWVDGFADALLFSRNSPHVTMGTNVRYAQLKEVFNNNLAKTFTDGLTDFGMSGTADVIREVQRNFIKKYMADTQMDTEELTEFDLFGKLDNVWRSTRIKPEEIQNITPLLDDVSDVSALSNSKNYITMQNLMIDGKKIGGY